MAEHASSDPRRPRAHGADAWRAARDASGRYAPARVARRSLGVPDPIAAAAAATADPAPASNGVDPVKAAADAAMAAGAPPVETPPPGVKPVDPEPGRLSALQRSIQQRERTVVQKQQELAARERQMGESVQQQIARGVQEQMAKLKEDPIGLLKSIGLDEQTIATRLHKGNAPQPDEIAAQALKAAQESTKQLAEWQRQQASQAAEREFLTEAQSGKYEHIESEWDRGELLQQAHAVATQLRQRGVDPGQYTMSDINKFLNERAKVRSDRREKIKAERAKKAGSQDPTKAEGNGVPGQGEAPGKTASTTTLGKGLGARQSLNGKPGHLMTDAELTAAVEAEVQRARAS